MYNLRFPLISLHDYDNAFNEHSFVFACSTYLSRLFSQVTVLLLFKEQAIRSVAKNVPWINAFYRF